MTRVFNEFQQDRKNLLYFMMYFHKKIFLEAVYIMGKSGGPDFEELFTIFDNFLRYVNITVCLTLYSVQVE